MTFLRLLGAGFLLAGAAVCVFSPELMSMGIAWVVTGSVLLGTAQVVASSAAKHEGLLQTGKAGRATILSATDTGVTLNNNPRVRFRVRIEVPGDPPIEATCALVVSRVAVPRVGEVLPVRFDPQRPDDFVFAPASPPPSSASTSPPPRTHGDDLLGPLERLADLRDRGALSPEEFAAAKRKVLGEQ
jgi:hypothetical protein